MQLPWKKIAVFCIELFFGINVVLVDIWLFTQSHSSTAPTTKQTTIMVTPTPSQIPFPTQTPQQTSPVLQQTPIHSDSLVKEFFIPLGSGSTEATDWTDISGALGYVDSAAYPKTKKVVLEATVTIPNGNETAWIRLFDKTDGHPVWYSETFWSGGTTQFVISQPITLDSGNKLYQIQVKNQLPSQAIVSNARIHITLQ